VILWEENEKAKAAALPEHRRQKPNERTGNVDENKGELISATALTTVCRRGAGVPPAVAGASRSRARARCPCHCGRDARATAGETPAPLSLRVVNLRRPWFLFCLGPHGEQSRLQSLELSLQTFECVCRLRPVSGVRKSFELQGCLGG